MEHGHRGDCGHHKQVCRTWKMLKWTYGLLFIIAGADKFINLVAHWTYYVSPYIINVVPVGVDQFILAVGLFEIVIGALILSKKTRIGAILAASWLFAISINLVSIQMFYDIAVRDIVMGIGAVALAMLTCAKE